LILTQETPISDKVDRIETIVETLEDGDAPFVMSVYFRSRLVPSA